ncbi:hypothetical protein E4U09_007521 [Claviceps aff. purpurea]|uniref:Uncharacterized protein n=1 Tax=Claviceps aff. purpurea TaxID=1967640 RepID=A0A9P7QJX6_9HYPO|nr:hypothetical protein E4U09_007521 [Claviceps aff. purpurea]
MSDAITERALAALDPDDFEGYDEVWREERRRERCRSPPTNEPLDDELKTGQHEQTASNCYEGPIKLSSGGENKALYSEKLEFTHKIPIYPNTHRMGYTYVVPAQLVDDVDKLSLQLGLAIKAPHGKKQTRCPFLGDDIFCARYRYICQGIKICRKARPEVRDYSWTSLTLADWKQLEQWRSKVDLHEPNGPLQRASGWYNNHKKLFFEGAACDPQLPSCRPTVHKASISGVTGRYYASVQCTNYHSETGRGHMRKDLSPQTVIDVDHLQHLFDTHYETAPTDLCGSWDTNNKKKRQCGHDHSTNVGGMEQKECSVELNYLVPEDIERCPWVLLSSHGVHNHAPPPPNFPPTKWGEFAASILSKLDDPNSATNESIKHEALKSALNEVGLQTLAAGNPGTLQGNRIENLLQFWKIDTYPCGPDLIEWEGFRAANKNAAEQSGGNTSSVARDGPDGVLTEGTRTEEVSDRRNMDSYFEYGIHHNQANRSNWNKHYKALRRQALKKRKRDELEDRIEENLNRQGGESSAFPEADLGNMHPNGATRTPAGQPSAPRNPSPRAGQDQTVRPTVESQSLFPYPAGLTLPPSQGRDNNGRSPASRTLEHTQSSMYEQLVEKERLVNEGERLRLAGEAQRQAGEAQRQGFAQRMMNLREEFTRSMLRRIEAGETEFDPRIFDFLDR